MTAEQRRRIMASLTETCELLEREMGYLPQNQDADRIEFYRRHIAKLEDMLNG